VPSYNLTQPQRDIVVTWLYEPDGWLDFAQRASDGQSARAALIIDPGLDVTQWIRDNQPLTDGEAWECGMVWWILQNDQVNWNPPQMSALPEVVQWHTRAQEIVDSINDGFNRVPQNDRDRNAVQLYDETGAASGTQPAGQNLAQQRIMMTNVRDLLAIGV
jgi:hypothetical protein